MELVLQNEPDEEASYHAEQVVVAACRPSRTGNKKAIYQRRVDCRDIRYDMLNEKSVKQPQDFVFIVELARQRALVVQIGLGRARNHAGEALPLGLHNRSSPSLKAIMRSFSTSILV